VTHDLRVARLFSDRFVLIHEGKVVVDGTYDDLHRSKDEMAVQFLKEGE
jgi:ABC-type transporter Mla maintaining outer membrane lipid asymmetry ATPase subunit MlaF